MCEHNICLMFSEATKWKYFETLMRQTDINQFIYQKICSMSRFLKIIYIYGFIEFLGQPRWDVVLANIQS